MRKKKALITGVSSPNSVYELSCPYPKAREGVEESKQPDLMVSMRETLRERKEEEVKYKHHLHYINYIKWLQILRRLQRSSGQSEDQVYNTKNNR